jgi:hypothetical protein
MIDNDIEIQVKIDLDELIIQLKKQLDDDDLFGLMQEISMMIKKKSYLKKFKDYLDEFIKK